MKTYIVPMFFAAIFFVGLMYVSCKDDDTPASPGGVVSGQWGSGVVNATSVAGNVNLTGEGVWPPGVGPSVIALYDTAVRTFGVLGYHQVFGLRYNFVLLGASMPSGVDTGVYAVGQVADFLVGYGADVTQIDSSVYKAVSGSINVDSVSGSSVAGRYFGQAVKGNGRPIQLSGTFSVTYVRGLTPISPGNAGPFSPQ